MSSWLICVGLGMLWHGVLIIWVGGLPRALRRGEIPIAEKGTPEAFGLFWLDQYSFIGIALVVSGSAIAIWGVLS